MQKQRLDIALLWAEGRLFDAWEKLGTGYLAQLRGATGFTRTHAGRRKRRRVEAADGVAHAYARLAQHVFDLKPVGAIGIAGSF